MKVQDLRDILCAYPGEMPVLLALDPEGATTAPLADHDTVLLQGPAPADGVDARASGRSGRAACVLFPKADA